MIFQSKQHKAEFVDYINFKIEMCDKDFLKKNKLIRGIGNLFSWNLLMLNFIVLLCMFAFFGLVLNAFSTFLIEIKNPFSVVYIISLLLSFGCLLLFSRVSKKDLFVYNSFKFKKLNDNDFIELKHYFTDSYIDELLVEYCERKNTESPLNWKLLIELFENVKKEIIQDSEIKMIKQKVYDNNEGKIC